MVPASKCAILVPVHYTVEPETLDGINELSRRGYPVFTLRGSSAIDMARTMLANQAIDAGFAETFWIDADVVFDPADVDKIRAHQLPFTAGLYPKKGRREFAGKFWPTTRDIVFGKGGGLLNMQYVGMGFTHIRAEVYHQIAQGLPRCGGGYEPGKKIIPYFLPMLVAQGQGAGQHFDYLSEDCSFCERARQVGYAVLADTTIRLDHIGQRKWCWEDFAPQTVYDSLQFSMAVAESAPVLPEETEPMSAKLYEKIGRQQEQLEDLNNNYNALLGLLAGVLNRQVDPRRLLVNLTERSWTLAPEGERPALPATINGVPSCIVAPPADLKPELSEFLLHRADALCAEGNGQTD